jgi:hypothetical protein
MELSKIEAEVLEAMIAEMTEAHVKELDNLQLALIGGGMGEAALN